MYFLTELQNTDLSVTFLKNDSTTDALTAAFMIQFL